MKYRIIIITYKSGRKTFTSQMKTNIGWRDLDYDGSIDWIFPYGNSTNSREYALERIDKNFAGNTKKQTIEFEYINK